VPTPDAAVAVEAVHSTTTASTMSMELMLFTAMVTSLWEEEASTKQIEARGPMLCDLACNL